MRETVAGQAGVGKVAAVVVLGVCGVGLVRAEMRAGVRLLWLAAAPSNLFSPALCAALLQALTDGFADTETRAIVLTSALTGPGQGFSGGMDLADMAEPWPADAPEVADVVQAVLGARIPVIAALHGACLGAGAEIALAAQGRVAAADVRIGLRDALVGSLPNAGGTQMLPRLVGAAEALRLIGRAVTVTAAEALALGIVDAVAAGDLVTAAVEMALMPPEAGRAPGLRDGRLYQAAVVAARRADGGDGLLGALADCVEAAQLLPLEQGLTFEAEAAAEVAARPEAGALRHLMMAEMRMAVDLGGGQAVGRIGLWGAGTGPLIWPALHAGLEVVFADDDREALLAEVEKVALAQEGQVAAGRLTPVQRDAEWARLRPGVAVADLAGLDLVIAAKPGVAGPVLHLGVWPEQGPEVPRLLLVAPGFGELQLPQGARVFGPMAAATLRRMRMRLAATVAPPATGVARALVRAARLACEALMAQGVSRGSLAAGLEGFVRLPLPEGAAGGMAMAVPEVRARVAGALAAAGTALLMQGAVRRAGDIDALAIAALGMPRQMGGPLFAADQRGLLLVRRDLTLWAQEHPVWRPPVLLDQLISDGARLSRHVVAGR